MIVFPDAAAADSANIYIKPVVPVPESPLKKPRRPALDFA